jgi:hypothetical protein
MVVSFYEKTPKLGTMKQVVFTLVLAMCASSLSAQIQRQEKKSNLDSDPEVVYLEQTLKKPIMLKVIREAPVYSDKDGNHRLGTLKADQMAKLEALSEKSYRVRGKGTRDGISGWVAPWAFSSTDPDFVAHLKLLYERQIQVQELIAAQAVAVGMTLDEVTLSLGKPTKTSVRSTGTTQTGRWEFIVFKDVKHYITRVDRTTGATFRQFSHITREETGKTAIEFENDLVTAVEQSEDNQGGNVKIIVPPLVYRW